MAGAAGPNTAESGLVFAYDTGNIITSYIGEPTTNIAYATNNNLNSGGNWWVNGGNATFNDNDTSIPKPSIPNVDTSNLRIFSSLVTAGGSNQQLGSSIITISPSTTYSFSIWYYFTGNSMVIYPYIRTAVNNDAIGVFSYNGNTDGTTWPKNQWILLKATGTTQANETGIYMSSYTGTAVGDKVYYFGYQVEQKGHCTPLVLGTRSATQGLLNLTGTSTINITNTTFDSNAQIEFDGTNDYIDSGYDLSWNNTNSVSVEFMVKPYTVSGGNYGIMGKEYPNWEWAFYQSSTTLNLVYWNNAGGHSNGMDFQVSVFPTANIWYHVIYTWDTTTSIFYVNGIAAGSTVAVNPSINQNRSNNVMIGGHTYVWADSYFNGKLDMVKFYNKALTTSEVQQNYQALRYRFGI